jgi:hypothetical protein
MKKNRLEAILKKARLPEIPAESLELFPRQVVAGLKRLDSPPRIERRMAPRLAWSFGLAACIVIAFALGHRYGQMENTSAADGLASVKFVRETLAMFPNQVRAITRDEDGMKLVLSQNNDVPTSPPIYVRICDGRHCASAVTFSGQEIQIAGQKLTVLSDSKGGIILTGNRFVWSNSEPLNASKQLKIEARNL